MVVASTVAAVQVYYNEKHGVCVNDPLVYAAQDMEDRFGYPFKGSGFFLLPKGKTSPTILFNANNITIQNPLGNYNRPGVNYSDINDFFANFSQIVLNNSSESD